MAGGRSFNAPHLDSHAGGDAAIGDIDDVDGDGLHPGNASTATGILGPLWTTPSSLVPVVILISLGFAAGRLSWIAGTAVKEFSNLVFLLLTPALLFRTMSKVQLANLDYTPVAAYFTGVIALFAGTLLV